MRIKIDDKKNFIEMFNQNYGQNLSTINGISIDSRNIEPNDIFIPIKGNTTDGHRFIKDVLKIRGTICFDENLGRDNKRIIKTNSNKKVLINMASLWRKKIKSNIIAITGSNGKTTTKDLLYHIMKNKFSCSKSKGNHNSTIGLPLTFLNCKINNEYAVLELGANKTGEIGILCKAIQPNYSLITNISNTHIGNFDSIGSIAECKSEIFSYLNSDGTAFININDTRIKKMDSNGLKITFGINNKKANYNGLLHEDSKMTINGFVLKIPDNIYYLNESILAAYTICNTLGVDNTTIQESINSFIIPDGRGSIIHNKKYKLINDTYNASPASMKFGIERFSKMKSKNHKILIIGDMLELGKHEIEEHKKLGNLINSKNIDIVLTMGDAMLHLYNTLNKNYKYKAHFLNIKKLKEKFKSIVKKNDIVFIKGSRKMKLEQVYN